MSHLSPNVDIIKLQELVNFTNRENMKVYTSREAYFILSLLMIYKAQKDLEKLMLHLLNSIQCVYALTRVIIEKTASFLECINLS